MTTRQTNTANFDATAGWARAGLAVGASWIVQAAGAGMDRDGSNVGQGRLFCCSMERGRQDARRG